MDDVRREIARLNAHLRLRALVGIGALTFVVFAMGGADVVARTAVAFAEGDAWTVSTKNASAADTTRLTVTSEVDTARIKVTNANIELAQQSSLPALPVAGTMAYDSTDSKFKVYNGSAWVVPAIPPTRTVVTKPFDESIANSAVLQDDDHLYFAIGPNETWVADFWIHAASSDLVASIKYAINTPSGVTSLRYWLVAKTFASGSTDNLAVRLATAPETAFECDRTLGQTAGHRIHVAVTNGPNAGNVTLRWAQRSARSVATTVKAGSRLIATKIQ